MSVDKSKVSKIKQGSGISMGGVLLNVAFTAPGLISDIKSGEGVVKSVAKAGYEWVKADLQMALLGGPATFALMGAQLAKLGIDTGLQVGREKMQNSKKNMPSGVIGRGFQDNEYAATMRQRSIQAMGGHQQMTRNAFGNEARRRSYMANY